MTSSLTIGLVGCGRWGKLILRDLLALGCRVWVMVPSAESRAEALRLGAAAVATPEQGFPGDPDGFVVASPTITHGPVVERLIPRGRPIFCEKPLTADLDSARRIVAAGEGLVFCMDKWRYHPGVEVLRRLAADGELGRVVSMRSTRIQWGQPHDGGGAVWILMPHDLSMVLHILGDIPPVMTATAEPGLSVDHGVIAVLGPMPQCVLEVSARRPSYTRNFHVVYEGGAAGFDGAYADTLALYRNGGKEPEAIALSKEMPLYKELAAFVAHLRGGPPPLSSARDALLVVQRITEIRAVAGMVP